MMAHRQKFTRFSLAARIALMLPVILCVGCGLIGLANSLCNWVLAETQSPTHVVTAAFMADTGALHGNVYFFVRDAARAKGSPLRIGGPYCSDGWVNMQEAVWSRDGSVIAVRVKIRANTEKADKDEETYWMNAYDFRRHQSISEGAKIQARSNVIKHLLVQRGGISPQTLSAPSATGRSMGWREALTFDTSNENYRDHKLIFND